MSLSEKEFYMAGRLESHHIPEIIKTRNDSGFPKKVPGLISLASNADYLLRNFDKLEFAYELLANQGLVFHKIGTVIDSKFPYLCCTPDGKRICS